MRRSSLTGSKVWQSVKWPPSVKISFYFKHPAFSCNLRTQTIVYRTIVHSLLLCKIRNLNEKQTLLLSPTSSQNILITHTDFKHQSTYILLESLTLNKSCETEWTETGRIRPVGVFFLRWVLITHKETLKDIRKWRVSADKARQANLHKSHTNCSTKLHVEQKAGNYVDGNLLAKCNFTVSGQTG